MSSAPPPDPAKRFRREVLDRPAANDRPSLSSYSRVLLVTAAICVPVAFLMWQMVPGMRAYGFPSMLVHAEFIGLMVALLTMIVRHVFAALPRSARWLLVPVLIPASFAGFVIGNMIARRIMGDGIGLPQLMQEGDLGISLLVSGLVTVALTWYFMSREQVVALKLAAAREGERAEAAKLAMLRAQIEPHMLFNTLANLRALIETDPERAVAMLDRFNEFLRKTLDSTRQPLCSLREEFDVLENYLELMKIRLGKRLDYTLDLPATLTHAPIPSLLLQPVVENAIRHGIEPALDGGRVEVSARAAPNGLALTITDTGRGMLASERAAADSARHCGFGLSSLHERLEIIGAGPNALQVESPVPPTTRGTRITIRVPA